MSASVSGFAVFMLGFFTERVRVPPLEDTFANVKPPSKMPSVLFVRYPATDSRVLAAAPHLVALLDESGLITVAGLDARPWGLHTSKYAFHYHQLMRRGFGSGINYGLIGTILRLSEKHNLTPRFALDERRVQFKDEYREINEHGYWYGPSLADADLDDLTVVGETFHGDPDGGTTLLSPYAGLSVRWTADGDLKTVEIEVFMPAPEPEAEWVFARYLHAIRDTRRQALIHCDGALKAFAADRYPRAQQDFKSRGKGDCYRKLFRIPHYDMVRSRKLVVPGKPPHQRIPRRLQRVTRVRTPSRK